MSVLGNILWLIFGGFLSAIGWCIAGMLCFITIIGVPFGVQCFKIAGLVLCPFGKHVELGRFGAFGLLGNIIWLLFCGIELAACHLASALVCAVTIIGIPFALQHIKLAALSLIPFGARVN